MVAQVCRVVGTFGRSVGDAAVPVVRVETLIRAPIKRCFDLARDPDGHARSVGETRERAACLKHLAGRPAQFGKGEGASTP